MKKPLVFALIVIGVIGVTWGVVMGTGPVSKTTAVMAAAVAAPGDAAIEHAVTQAILDGYEYTKQNNAANPEDLSSKGIVEFWSSGGLMHEMDYDDVGSEEYESFNVVPSHIRVVVHSDDVATALFYAEGAFAPKGFPAVTNYLCRVTETLVKENGRWVSSVAHYSPITGGSGTTQTTVD